MIMKRKLSQVVVFLSTLSLMLTLHSCLKSDRSNLSMSRLIPIVSNEKTDNQYMIVCFLGHDGSKCPGCVMINGKIVHVDCQGEGNACNKVSQIALSSTGSSLTATTMDTFGLTNLDFLNMPAQSFSLEIDEGVYSYLNIPAQLVFRDSTTRQFTFTGLFFTNVPEYSND